MFLLKSKQSLVGNFFRIYYQAVFCLLNVKDRAAQGGGDSYIKQTGLLVVLLRGVNFGCLVSLRVFWEKPLSHKALL